MATPALEQIQAALATVNDPEIRRPITDLGMVDSVEVDDAGVVHVTVLLTVSGCPLKDTITRDVNAAVGKVPGVTGVDLTLGVMTPSSARASRRPCAAASRRRRSPSAGPTRSPRSTRSPAARAASASPR